MGFMRNYWLERKPRVIQVDESLTSLASWKWGTWFIVKSISKISCFLHKDGTWNDATWKENDGNLVTGFYETKEEAEAVLRMINPTL